MHNGTRTASVLTIALRTHQNTSSSVVPWGVTNNNGTKVMSAAGVRGWRPSALSSAMQGFAVGSSSSTRCFVTRNRPTRRRFSPGGGGGRASHGRTTSSHCFTVPEEERGVFQNRHWKPFPLRAAMDIGGGGVLSLGIGRVDAGAGALQKLVYHTQLPLHLESVSATASPSSSSFRGVPPFALTECSITDITNKMQILMGAIERHHRQHGGVDERAAVLTWPVCEAENAPELAAFLTQRFQVNVKVLGKDFAVDWPMRMPPIVSRPSSTTATTPSSSSASSLPSTADDREARDQRSTSSSSTDLKALIRHALQEKKKTNAQHSDGDVGEVNRSRHDRLGHASADRGASASLVVKPPAAGPQDTEALAFLSHAAASQCLAPQRMLVIDEDPQRGIRLVGSNTSAVEDCQDTTASSDSLTSDLASTTMAAADSAVSERYAVLQRAGLPITTDPPAPHPPQRLVEYRLPVAVQDAHRLCITTIQHRPAALYHLHRSSPNPVQRGEFTALRDLLAEMIRPALPAWVRRKAVLGGVIAGTSFNGGLLNLAARVSQRSSIPREHLEVNAEHAFCGLTDVLLGQNFPHPGMVLPSAALASALFRVLETPRVHYIPEVSTAVGLLLQPQLWSWQQRRQRSEALAQDPFYASARHRVFYRPHMKSNPTAAPTAHWKENGGGWNPKSYEWSSRGTN